MDRAIAEFSTPGPVKSVSAAIEACANERRVVSALVVPWESDRSTLRMAVTSATGDGWAVEHTNLGTITLAAVGDATKVTVIAHEPDPSADENPDAVGREKMTAVLVAFARQIERKLGSARGSEALR